MGKFGVTFSVDVMGRCDIIERNKACDPVQALPMAVLSTQNQNEDSTLR